MGFQMIMNGNGNRAWRCAAFPGAGGNPAYKTATVVNFQNSRLPLQSLTPHSSDVLDPRNVVPYYTVPVVKTTGNLALPGTVARGQASDASTFVSPEVRIVTSSNIQLNGFPDKLIISVRKVVANLGCHQTNKYATIKCISINFNNQAGLLSSMTPEQLFRHSVQSSLAYMRWDEFCGSMVSCCGTRPATNAGTAAIRAAFQRRMLQLGRGGRTNPSVQYVPTTGTILVLKFAEVINLTEEYYAPRSLGTISLQINVQAQNNQNEDWAAKSYELVIMTLNSGVFVNDRGTSSTFLPCSQRKTCWTLCNNNPTLTLKSRRLVGGGCLDNVRSTMGWIQSRLPADTGTLEHVLHQYAHTGANVLNTLGYGKGETHRPQANMIKKDARRKLL